jgi:predicted RNase H-like HicB family nuclease
MAMNLLEERRFGSKDELTTAPVWTSFCGATYECRVLLCPEEDGGYSAHAMRLPGVVSQGETIDEALKNISEAFAATIRTYRDHDKEIPWSKAQIERTKGCEERWIIVNA